MQSSRARIRALKQPPFPPSLGTVSMQALRYFFRWMAGVSPGILAGLVAVPPAALAGQGGLQPFDIVVASGLASIPVPLTGKPGDPKEGVKAVTGRRLGNCLSCHEVSALRSEEFHGDVGPSLDGVAGRWDAAALRMIVVNAKMVFGPETVMPAFYRVEGLNRVRPEFAAKPILTAQQVEDVVAFLTTLK
jgi:L-cysteine S-thiosulfotransferase